MDKNIDYEFVEQNFEAIISKGESYAAYNKEWYKEEYGIAGREAWLITTYFKEKPSETMLSKEENTIRRNIMSWNPNAYDFLREAKMNGSISEEVYKKYIPDNAWYINCFPGDNLYEYRLRLKQKMNIFRILKEREDINNGIIRSISSMSFNIFAIFFADDGNHGIKLREMLCGRSTLVDNYVLYPYEEGESEKEHKEKLRKIALEQTKDIEMDEDEKIRVIDIILDKREEIVHICPNVLKVFSNAKDEQARANIINMLNGIDDNSDGGKILSGIGLRVYESAALPPQCNMLRGTPANMGLMQSNKQNSNGEMFVCRNCKTSFSGKFCPECGTAR